VVVARSGKTRLPHVAHAMRLLQEAHARAVGLVINGA
jgi:Mrp family chromosome partitioning ATPase